MALVLKRLYSGYFWTFNEMADPRVKDYFLLSSPLVPISIMASYLYFIFNVGPKIMENRKPFQMKTILALYNFSQIMFNVILIFLCGQVLSHLNFDCNLVDYTLSPEGKSSIRLAYLYHLLKIYDLLDTVFIILRKNMRQVSFLHVYHHCGMVAGTFIAAKFIPGGELLWTGFINIIVHAVMYFYYLMSTLDSKWKKYTTAKKFLTQLQLIQFAVNILIYGRLLFKPDCHFPILIPLIYVPQNIFMITLFGDFYIKAYVLKK